MNWICKVFGHNKNEKITSAFITFFISFIIANIIDYYIKSDIISFCGMLFGLSVFIGFFIFISTNTNNNECVRCGEKL